MKILLARASPRCNIPEVEDENSKLPCDKLLVQYFPEIPAYKVIRDYFLKSDYDYLVLATDDIIVKPEHIERLKQSLEVSGVPVLSGYMNVDQHEWQNGNVNICYELALKDKKLRYYNWIKNTEIPDKEFFQVKFAGFGLTAIRRDIVEKYEFAGDGIFKGKGMTFGASLDFVFCWWCHENQVPIWADSKIYMQHLRTSGTHRVGEKSRRVFIWRENGEAEKIDENWLSV